MKNYLLLLMILPLINSCVTHKIYVPINVPKELVYEHITSNNLRFNFSISQGNNKKLIICIWFNDGVKQQEIKNITFDLLARDGSHLNLEPVEISSYVNKKDVYKGYIKSKSFVEIPFEFRVTSNNKIGTQLIFDYYSNKKITSKYLKVKYNIVLEDGSNFTDSFDLKLFKFYRFAIH